MPVFKLPTGSSRSSCFASYFMQYGPPPLFKQGTPARVKVIIFVLAAIALLFVDSHLQVLGHVRKAVGMVLYPVQKVAMVPRDIYDAADEYLTSIATLHEEVSGLREKSIQDATRLQRAQLLESENAQLRELLGMSKRVNVKSLPAEILYDARNTFVRKVILNKGSQDGVLPGQPVIDDKGVIGQVTDVYLNTCEVTLLTDKDQAIPVLNVRSGERSVAYGRGQSGYLELRFMMANADIQPEDLLVTSGIDGVYPAGLAVGKVARIRDNSTGSFDHVICEPVAGINRNRQVLVLLSDTAIPPRPTAADRTVNIRQRVNPKAEEPKK